MSRAVLILNDQYDRRKASNWIEKAAPGTRVEFKERQRSKDQNDKMWAMLTEIAQQGRINDQKFKPDQWKVILMHACGHEVQFLPALDGTTFIPWGQSSSDLSVSEMRELIDFMTAWGAQNGIIFKDQQSEQLSSPAESVEGGGTAATPPPSLPSKVRQDLIDFARKALKSTKSGEDLPAKLVSIDRMEKGYRDVIAVEFWPTLHRLAEAAYAVAEGTRSIERAERYIANQLDCTVAELGGAA